MESEHTVCGRRSSLMSSLNGLATEHSVVNRIIQYASKKLMGAVGEFVDRRNAGPPGDILYLPMLLNEFVWIGGTPGLPVTYSILHRSRNLSSCSIDENTVCS